MDRYPLESKFGCNVHSTKKCFLLSKVFPILREFETVRRISQHDPFEKKYVILLVLVLHENFDLKNVNVMSKCG